MDTKTKPAKVKLTGDITNAPLKVRSGLQAGADITASSSQYNSIGSLRSHVVSFSAWSVGG